MRYLVVVAALWTGPALALDTIQDCKTYGPHSSSCARATQNRDNPDAIVRQLEQQKREADRQRSYGHGSGNSR